MSKKAKYRSIALQFKETMLPGLRVDSTCSPINPRKSRVTKWKVTPSPVRLSPNPVISSTPMKILTPSTRTRGGKRKLVFDDSTTTPSKEKCESSGSLFSSPGSYPASCTSSSFNTQSPSDRLKKSEKSVIRENSRKLMEKYPKDYLGNSKNWLSILDLLI